jgi:hypothetical protein
MQSTQDRTGEYATNGLNGTRNRRILAQGEVRARLIVVIQIRPQQMTEMASPKTITWSMHSRRIDPISRSA